MFAAAVAALPKPAEAQTWRFVPSISAQETVTNNVDLQPNDTRQYDWVTQLTPALSVTEKGTRTRLSALLSLPVVLYAKGGSDRNSVYPAADVLGDIALVDHWLHVEGQISIAQQYFSPFGAQPLGLENVTQNRYRSETYRISPYVQGVAPGNVVYELRNNNVWVNATGAPVSTSSSKYTQFTGNASRSDTTLGWRADFDVNDTTFNGNGTHDTFRTRLVRLMPLYNIDPQLRLLASVGYEENDFPFDSSSNAVYGAGLEWHPTNRTSVVAKWEHRFFGASYLFTFDHRTPLSVWNVNVSRNITSFPQQLASLSAGADVASLLNGLFLTAIPDPAQRQLAIDQFIRDRGLPAVLTNAVTLYSQRILLQESQSASAGLIGVHNTVVFTIFNVRTQPISASGNVIDSVLTAADNNRQTGVTLVWSHKLSPTMALDTTIERLRTVANPPFEATTNQTALRLVASTPLSPKTTVFAGARYQTFSSDVASGYNEAAAFIGVTYTFR
ncbi:MAG TPA: TIGR03016 family PEP-CTERM system-associated outer membrane protein [Casimicrobiaceae bacterium]|nr:TIGR03016 family PEP-CTERM system-associated outer membrane protein [Casimicrobiaceae bacterium]